MQGKGLIKLFFVLLVAVTLLQIFYTFPTRKVEQDANRYAKEFVDNNPGLDAYEAEKRARFQYLDSVGTEDILNVPLLGSFTYEELKSKQLNLGLDLKGGMSAVLQVDLKDLLIRLSGDNKDPNFLAALDAAEKAFKEQVHAHACNCGNAHHNLTSMCCQCPLLIFECMPKQTN